MRIQFVVNRLAFGGAETQVMRVATGLQSRGHSVGVTTLLPNVAYEESLLNAGVTISRVGLSPNLLAIFDIPRALHIVRDSRPDVVVPFLFNAECIARLSRILGGKHRLISSIRSENIGSRVREWLLRATAFVVDEWITNSKQVANRLNQRRAFGDRVLQVIPNGLDLEHLQCSPETRYQVRTEARVPDQAFVWIAVGAQRPPKNYVELIKAFSHCADSRDFLWIVGAPCQQSLLDDVARKQGVTERVVFWGRRDDVPRLLHGADAFVLASTHEGSPNALLEAAACGLPSVATDVGGVRELITDEQGGFIVAPHNTDALIAGMRRLRNLPDVARQMMGEQAKKITAWHDLEHVLDKWERLLEEVCRR